MELTGERDGRQDIHTEPERAAARRVTGWGQQKYRLTILFSVTALVVIALAATVANYVIGGLAERDLIRLAERNTFRDAIHIQSMMRGQHSMIGMASSDPMTHGADMGKMDQPMTPGWDSNRDTAYLGRAILPT